MNITQPMFSFNISAFISSVNVFMHGDVLNRTFLPPFKINSPGFVNCSFYSVDTPQAETDKYESLCDWAPNITSIEQLHATVPVVLLKQLENITQDRSRLAKLEGESLFLWLAVIGLVISLSLAIVLPKVDEVREEVIGD